MQEVAASLCFRGQRTFLHNASGWFGDAPLEASGDFGLNPEEGEFHLMCQVYFIVLIGSFGNFIFRENASEIISDCQPFVLLPRNKTSRGLHTPHMVYMHSIID